MDEEIYLQWFTRKNISAGTQTTYRVVIDHYKEFTQKNLNELLDEAESEEEQGIRLRKRSVTKYLIGFKAKLEKNEYAPGTINNHIAALKSFYNAFDIQTPDIALPKGDICLEKNYGKLLTKEEINSMLNVANARDRALIYLLALSGMSQAEARNLKITDFLDSASLSIGKKIDSLDKLFDYEDLILEEILTLNIVRKKINYRYQTFIPPEASKAIISYLKERKYNRNKKRHIKNLQDTLFITNNGDPMSKTGVGTAIKRVGRLAGFESPEGAYCYWRPHAFRKYFISTIINSIGDHILADYLAGHKISNVKRAYWIMDPESLKVKYIEALPYLSLDNIKVIDLKSEEFKAMMEDSKNKDQRIIQMEAEHKQTEKKVEQLEDIVHGLLKEQLKNDH